MSDSSSDDVPSSSDFGSSSESEESEKLPLLRTSASSKKIHHWAHASHTWVIKGFEKWRKKSVKQPADRFRSSRFFVNLRAEEGKIRRARFKLQVQKHEGLSQCEDPSHELSFSLKALSHNVVGKFHLYFLNSEGDEKEVDVDESTCGCPGIFAQRTIIRMKRTRYPFNEEGNLTVRCNIEISCDFPQVSKVLVSWI